MGIQQINVKICLYLWFLTLAVPNALSVVIFTQMRMDLLSSLLIKMIEENTKGKEDKSICTLSAGQITY